MIKLRNGRNEKNEREEKKMNSKEKKVENCNDTTARKKNKQNVERKNGRIETEASPSHSNSINQLVDFLVSSSLTFNNFQALHSLVA